MLITTKNEYTILYKGNPQKAVSVCRTDPRYNSQYFPIFWYLSKNKPPNGHNLSNLHLIFFLVSLPQIPKPACVCVYLEYHHKHKHTNTTKIRK